MSVSPLFKTLVSILNEKEQIELALDLIERLNALPVVVNVNVLFDDDLKRMAQDMGETDGSKRSSPASGLQSNVVPFERRTPGEPKG